MIRSAEISNDKKYRWTLYRDWRDEMPMLQKKQNECVFVGLNPSTADGKKDDNTIRLLISFCKRWEMTGFYIVNVYPFRSTNPVFLKQWFEHDKTAAGAMVQNLMTIQATTMLWPGNTILCCGSGLLKQHKPGLLLGILDECLIDDPLCFDITNDNMPRHPLRMPLDTRLKRFCIPSNWKE